MDIFFDATLMMGLLTLIALEIVLGIDNLVFIAILADKLPHSERDRARVIGLALALVLRLGLLASISWLVSLTTPWVTLWGKGFSGRDAILIAGGFFLLFKATTELHERLEGVGHSATDSRQPPGFWGVIVQIMVLDLVFSIDSVITAVGMVNNLPVMMIAVVVAVALMMLASKPLTAFVNARPTVIILCLGFLMMIGFSLVADGFGLHIPKGYLYAAICFSIVIESFNQIASFKYTQRQRRIPLRQRTAEAVLRLLGAGQPDAPQAHQPAGPPQATLQAVFSDSERKMVKGVLNLPSRPVKSLMTPRRDISWIDMATGPEDVVEQVLNCRHSHAPVARGDVDGFVGVVRIREALERLVREGRLDLPAIIRQPLMVFESAGALHVLDDLRRAPLPLAMVVDEYGSIEGLVTVNGILAAMAGAASETQIRQESSDSSKLPTWLVDGALPLADLSETLGEPVEGGPEYHTVAGLVADRLGRIPREGESVGHGPWLLEVVKMADNRVEQVRVSRQLE